MSLLLNGKSWVLRPLGEKAFLLEPEFDEEVLIEIHRLQQLFEKNRISGLSETVPAYRSIALIFKDVLKTPESIDQILENMTKETELVKVENKEYEVPVCFELGLDWEEVSSHLKLTKDEIIEKYILGEYSVAMMGFLPGFIFLDGLDPVFTVPRKGSPRTRIPPGSVGIGGSQTGIYSIESPGGWNIIGRTPHSFFDLDGELPTTLRPGDRIRFKRISKDMFSKLNEQNENG